MSSFLNNVITTCFLTVLFGIGIAAAHLLLYLEKRGGRRKD